MKTRTPNEPIAVIGLACRFPGGANPKEFWRFLARGGDAVSQIPPDRWNVADFYDPDPNAPGKMYTKAGAFLADYDHFSPAFFGISPREAQFMDPQQRLLLEVSWEALENASVVPQKLAEQQVGVFVGIGTTDYGDQQVPLGSNAVDAYNGTGGSHAAAAGRLSYLLGVRGPSFAIDSACSSSLVTAHLAMMSLRSGESDLALASGVNLNFAADVFVSLCKARMLSPDGRCKTFDASANGYVRGEGCGVVVLKRLSDALADGDHIHALLRGSAVNHNGRSSGLTVPSGPAQQEVIRTALRNAGIAPAEVSYLEAHGTGTAVGDPIEASALADVFAGRETPLLLGSVKTNCGHLEWAAGVCGLIKVILSMQHDVIPASLHYNEPNPLIKWDKAPFRVVTEPTPWPSERMIAGVSSFGFGGTNAHVVVEAAPRVDPPVTAVDRPLHVLTLSAKSEGSLRELASRIADDVAEIAPGALANLSFAANVGRSHFEHRLVAVGADKDVFVGSLREFAAGRPSAEIRAARSPDSSGALAMLFTGQGSQWPGMGRELYATQPTFRRAIDRSAAALQPLLDRSLLDVLFPDGVAPADASAPIHDTAYTQPALFALEYALAELWRSWGVEPDVVLGHSVGEYAAACVAGVFSLEDGLRLIAARGRLMQALPLNGAMVALRAAEQAVAAAVEPYRDAVSIAAINGPQEIVISGERGAVEAIVAQLEAGGVAAQRLHVSHAFHSPLMEPMLDEFRRVAETVAFRRPNRRLISNVTARAAGEELTDPGYWVRHVRAAVRFGESVRAAADDGCTRFLEIGPQPVLCALGQSTLRDEAFVWLPSLHAKRGEWQTMLASLATLELQGFEIAWDGFDRDYPRTKLPLSTYPFERQRYWFPGAANGRIAASGALLPLVESVARSPLVKETVLAVSLGTASHPYLADHRVYDQVIVPGAVYLAMLAGGAELLGWPSCRMSDVYFLAPLALPEGEARTVQAVLVPAEDGAGAEAFAFTTVVLAEQKDDELEEAFRLASGRFERLPAAPPASIDVAELRRRCSVKVTPEDVFEAAAASGVELGPRFRSIEAVWTGRREALARLRVGEETGGITGYRLHPVLLDGCFQIAGATLMDETGAETLLPFAVRSLEIRAGSNVAACWCHAVRTGDATWDIRLFDDDGIVIAALDGFEMRNAPADRFLRRRIGDWLYRSGWELAPLKEAPVRTAPGTWLILSDGGELGAALACRLEELGHRCVVIGEGDATDSPAVPYRGVVHLRSLADVLTESTRAERAQQLAIGLLQLAQASTPAERLLVVTRGAQPVLAGEDADPAAAPLWGMIRTLALEAPELHAGGVDLASAPIPVQVDAILAELVRPPSEPQIAYRGGDRYAARLVRYREAIVAPNEGPFRLQLAEYGSPDQLRLVPMARRAPGPEEVEIAVKATALNFRDVLISLGMLKDFYAGQFGITRAADIRLGFDCAGTITAVGERVGDLAVGDTVMAAAVGGTASHVTIFRECVTRIPCGLDFATAAAIPNVFLTAYHALVRLAELKAGERVLIHAAAGGVGLAAIQIAHAAGAEVFATASPAKWEYLRSQGVVHVMNSRTLDFAAEIRRITGGGGVDVVLNSLSGPAIDASFAVLADGGRFVELGKLGIWTAEEASARRPDATYHTFELGAALDREPAAFQAYGEDVLRKFEAGVFAPLPQTIFPITDAAEAYRYMQQAKHIGKVVMTLDEAQPAALRPDASYLITGGLGGLGLQVAQQLVADGARHLVLAGRSEPGAAALRAIDAMQLAGACVTVVRGDVARPADVAVMIEASAAQAPLKGIVHAAGVLDDALLRNQTAGHIANVMAAKAGGAWELHRQTSTHELDFFVAFSSMASLVGSPGQTNYAAANAFLDALAHHRRANGLPGLSINWGPWADVGMAADLNLSGGDVEKLDLESGRSVFSALLRMSQHVAPAQVGVFNLRPKAFAQRWSAVGVPPYFTSLVAASAPSERSGDALLTTVRAASADEQVALLTAYVHDTLRGVLALGKDDVIENGRPWVDLGLDSLMMVEVKNRLERSLRLALPVELLMQDVNVDKLVTFMLERIGQAPAEIIDAPAVHAAEEDAIRLEIIERVREIPQAFTTVDAQDRRRVLIDGRWRLDFASCNYLGFDLEPEIVDAILPAVAEWGVHPSWTRAVASPGLYAELERELAAAVGAAHTLVFPSISLLHLGVLPALAGFDGVIIKDAEAHHSIHEACRRAQADGVEWHEFRHNDVGDLERRLSAIRLERPKIIATDGAYSMGSPTPPLHEYARLAREYNATLYIDDAHGFGIFGAEPDEELPYGYGGGGIVRRLGLDYERDRIVYVAGLSKAFSSYAAFVTCRDEHAKVWLQTSGPYVFSGPTSVASLATALAGLRLNRRDGDLRRMRIHALARRLVSEAVRIGFEVDNDGEFPIVGVVIGGWEAMVTACRILWEHDILITPATYPAVPAHRNLVRFSLTSANTDEELDRAIRALRSVWAALHEEAGIRESLSPVASG